MSYTLEKTFRFEAGHILSHHDGKCRFPHGHSYVLTIRIRSDQLQSSGPKKNMVIDFSDLSTVASEMINNYFDHHWLNDTLETDAPTVEYIAKWIFDYLHPKLPNLHSVTLHETATSSVTYSQ